ncbi:MAG: hypothetical protein HUU57_06110 [Bdellovibrio sp.]|nr:hypothetical protein [Bdellovibrio sp.]
MSRSLLFLFTLLAGCVAQAAVWTEVNQWSPAFETRFHEWVQNEWRTDFFSRKNLPNGQSNPYYGLRMDCADTVYSMRAVFSYENKLPFVIQDPTSSGKTISNKMSRWDGKDELTRVRSFMWFLYETISTRSLPNDTYPIAITRETVVPGSLMLTTKKNHHSWTVKEILPIGVPYLVYNSVVGAGSGFGLQERQSWPNPEWVFQGDASANGNAGFRYWRPEAYLNKPVWQVPGYSDEQYRVALSKWTRFAQDRLALRQETDQQLVTRLLKTTCEGFTGRVTSVNEGAAYLRSNPRCMDYATYDTYSTPNRDRRVFDDFMALRRAYREILSINGGNQLAPELIGQLNKIFPAITHTAAVEAAKMGVSTEDAVSVCVAEYLPGKKMDLAEFKRRLFAGHISNNPHDGAEYRWGDVRGPSQRAKSCQSWDPWSPDLTAE